MKLEEKFQNLINKARNILFLKDEEKEVLRSDLMDYMKKNPLKEAVPSRNWASFAMFTNKNFVLRYAPIAAVFVILFGFITVSYAAQNALPGDILYPIKTGVNEKVAAFVTFSDQGKAQYYANLVTVRLQEAEELESKNKLDDNKTISNTIKNSIDNSITEAKNHSEVLSGKDNADFSVKINSEIESSLSAHVKILDKLSEKNQHNISNNFKDIINNVQDKIDNAKKARQDSEDKLFLQPSSKIKNYAENKFTAANNKLDEVNKFLENKKDNLDSSSYDSAKTDLKSAGDLISQGQQKLQDGNYNEAFSLFQQAINLTQETKISVEAESRLKINIQSNFNNDSENNNNADNTQNNARANSYNNVSQEIIKNVIK